MSSRSTIAAGTLWSHVSTADRGGGRGHTVKRYIIGLAAVVALCSATAGCGDDDTAADDDSSSDGKIGVTLSDFDIQLDSTSVPAGEVVFDIDNQGPSTHEFVVVQSDKAADALPTADGDVDEDGVEAIDEVEDIESDATPSLTVDLDPGHYVVFCNLPGHYKQGMSAEITVT